MDWTSAPIIEDAPLEPARGRFLPAQIRDFSGTIEALLERERAQLPLWFTAAFGTGIAGWLWLAGPSEWSAFLLIALGLAAGGSSLGPGRIGRALLFSGIAVAAGCALIWWRSNAVAAPRLNRPTVITLEGRIEQLESRAAKGDLRLTLVPSTPGLPPLVRVSLPEEGAPAGLGDGAVIKLRARLQPPPPMALPGSHDFA